MANVFLIFYAPSPSSSINAYDQAAPARCRGSHPNSPPLPPSRRSRQTPCDRSSSFGSHSNNHNTSGSGASNFANSVSGGSSGANSLKTSSDIRKPREVDPKDELASAPWYQPTMPRDIALDMLARQQVRSGRPADLVLGSTLGTTLSTLILVQLLVPRCLCFSFFCCSQPFVDLLLSYRILRFPLPSLSPIQFSSSCSISSFLFLPHLLHILPLVRYQDRSALSSFSFTASQYCSYPLSTARLTVSRVFDVTTILQVQGVTPSSLKCFGLADRRDSSSSSGHLEKGVSPVHVNMCGVVVVIWTPGGGVDACPRRRVVGCRPYLDTSRRWRVVGRVGET